MSLRDTWKRIKKSLAKFLAIVCIIGAIIVAPILGYFVSIVAGVIALAVSLAIGLVALLIDKEAALSGFHKAAEAVGEVVGAVGSAVGKGVSAIGQGLTSGFLSTPFGWIVLGVAGVFLYNTLSSGKGVEIVEIQTDDRKQERTGSLQNEHEHERRHSSWNGESWVDEDRVL